jgi:hypothetical protein
VAFIPPGSHRISDLENCHGLLGRCALNTETAAVNPRVGVAGPPRGVAYIPMPSPTRQCFDNLGSLAEIRRLCNPEGGRKLDGGKRVSERHLRYHAHNPRAPRQGRRNVPLSAQPERDPENCSSGDLQWSAVVCSGFPKPLFAVARKYAILCGSPLDHLDSIAAPGKIHKSVKKK